MNKIDMDFLLRPMEPLFFGKPSPFNAGESHYSRSQFPPSPMTVQGILRSQLLRAADPPLNLDDWSRMARKERRNLVGSANMLPGNWQIQGPLPAEIEKKEEYQEIIHPWVPAPRFLYASAENPHEVIQGRVISSTQPFLNDLSPDPNDNSFDLIGELNCRSIKGWINSENLWWALKGEGRWNPKGFSWETPPFIKSNQRQPGIALDRKKNTACDGMLYLLEHLRFAPNSGFWGHFAGSIDQRINGAIFKKSVGGAGRKGRLIAFESGTALNSRFQDISRGEHLATTPKNGEQFWLYLLTPVRMTNEADKELQPHEILLPGGVILHTKNKEETIKLPKNIKITCRAALTAPPITLGGMDMAKGSMRPNHSYVPPGSAWLIKIEGGDEAERLKTIKTLNNSNLLGDVEEARFGFGHALIGMDKTREYYNAN